MVNDWNVHHLHISTRLDPDGFVKRDDSLLFVVFKKDRAYLIDVMNHGDWVRDHVLQVLVDEWPSQDLICEVKGCIGLARPVLEEDRKVLRKKHVNSSFEYKGKVYSPVGFMSSAGTTFAAQRAADEAIDRIEKFEASVRLDPEWLVRVCSVQGVKFPVDPSFVFAIREDGYGVIETSSRSWFRLSSPLLA